MHSVRPCVVCHELLLLRKTIEYIVGLKLRVRNRKVMFLFLNQNLYSEY